VGSQAGACQDLLDQLVEFQPGFVRHAGERGSGQEQRRGIHVHDDLVEPLADHHLDAGRSFATQGLAGLSCQA
jgi:hypothetical protein